MKAKESQQQKKIEQLEQRLREADVILSTVVLMELHESWPGRTKRAIEDWMSNRSIWSQPPDLVEILCPAAGIKRKKKSNDDHGYAMAD